MRTAAAVATLLTAACSATPANVPATASQDGHAASSSRVAIRDLPQLPAHGPDTPIPLSTVEANSTDPRQVGEQLIATGLRSQGLELLDVGVVTITADDRRTTVRIAATHQMVGGNRPHTSVYDLDLVRTTSGGWELARWRTVR